MTVRLKNLLIYTIKIHAHVMLFIIHTVTSKKAKSAYQHYLFTCLTLSIYSTQQIKAELGRILGSQALVKDMREKYSLTKLKLLTAIKTSKIKEVKTIVNGLEMTDSTDVTGMILNL